MNMGIWVVGTSNQLFRRGSYSKTKFSTKQSSYYQSSVLRDRSILYSPSIYLNIDFWQGSFVWKCCALNGSTFIFQKICFKAKVVNTLKIPSGCHIKTYWSLKRGAILKIPSAVFRRTHALSIGFKMKSLKKAFSCVKAKTNANFAVKVAERSNHSFSVYLIKNFVQSSVIFINMCSGIYRTRLIV